MLVDKVITIIFILILVFSRISARATDSMYHSPDMDTMCDRTVVLNGDTLPGTFFKLTSGHYDEYFDCTLTIRASTVHQRIIVVMDEMDIACGGDKLLIYDGKRDDKTLLNKDEVFQCGEKNYYFQSIKSNTVIIEFLSNGDGRIGRGFVLNVVINFPVPSCAQIDGFYRCHNHNCISRTFRCSHRNWCGDDSQRDTCR